MSCEIIVTIPVSCGLGIFGGIELLTGITGVGGGIAHFAHLGGLIFGYLLIMYWKKKRTLYGRDY